MNEGFEIVVVATSLGGLKAVGTLLFALPVDFALPLVIVQHRTAASLAEDPLCDLLQRCCALPVIEPRDKQPVAGGSIYLAPADYHLLVEGGAFALSTEAPVNFARPSADVLFESAADAYGAAAVGVVLTGGNEDGARGLARLRVRGGLAVVQDPATAESAVMPEAAIQIAGADHVLPLAGIAALLAGLSVNSAALKGMNTR